MSGLVALIPAKKPTPKNTIKTIDKNLLKVFFICLILSFTKAFFIFYVPFNFLFAKIFYHYFLHNSRNFVSESLFFIEFGKNRLIFGFPPAHRGKPLSGNACGAGHPQSHPEFPRFRRKHGENDTLR